MTPRSIARHGESRRLLHRTEHDETSFMLVQQPQSWRRLLHRTEHDETSFMLVQQPQSRCGALLHRTVYA